MKYYHFPVILAACLTCWEIPPSLSQESLFKQTISSASSLSETKIIAQADVEIDKDKVNDEINNYNSLITSANQAIDKGDYQKALEDFQKALIEKPEDIEALKGISKVKSHAYDSYMQSGYLATVERDYSNAISFFEKALILRPDDFYSQKAITNVKGYILRDERIKQKQEQERLKQQKQEQEKSLQSQQINESIKQEGNLVLIVFGIIAILILFSFIFLILPVKKTSDSSENPEFDLETSEDDLVLLPQNNILNSQPITEDQSSELELSQNIPEDHQENSSKTQEHLNQQPQIPIIQKPETKVKPHQVKPQPKSKTKSKTKPKANNQLALPETTRLPNADLVQDLIQDLEVSNPSKRRKAVWELAQKGDSRAVKPLVKLIIDSDSNERGLILEALSQISSRTVKPMKQALAMSLQDENPQVRKNAIRDVTKIYDVMNQIRQLLENAAKSDPDPEVREVGEWALKKLNLVQLPPQVDKLPDISISRRENSASNGVEY